MLPRKFVHVFRQKRSFWIQIETNRIPRLSNSETSRDESLRLSRLLRETTSTNFGRKNVLQETGIQNANLRLIVRRNEITSLESANFGRNSVFSKKQEFRTRIYVICV